MEANERARLFEQWIVPHMDAAYNVALWLSRSEPDAEDVVQEASMKAFRKLETFDGRDARAWFLTIVRNEFYSMVRTRPKAKHESLDAPDDLAGDSATPEEAAIAQLDRKQVWDSLGKLAAEFREAIILREFEGLSYREIAEMCSVPLGTVMSRLARARAQLQRDLARTQGARS